MTGVFSCALAVAKGAAMSKLTVRQEAEREAEIDQMADRIENLLDAREKAILALCVHHTYLTDMKREHQRLVDELEALRGGE